MTDMVTMAVIGLRGQIASLTGELEGVTAWQRDPVWRNALLEKLLGMNGFSKNQIMDIMHRMKKEGIAVETMSEYDAIQSKEHEEMLQRHRSN